MVCRPLESTQYSLDLVDRVVGFHGALRSVARMGAGTGEAGGTPPSTAIVSDCFPPDRRPMAMTVLALGAPIGAWIALDVAGGGARIYHCRHAFLALRGPGVGGRLVVFLTIL